MKVVSGIVSHNRHTAEVSGNAHGVGTSQLLGFRIGKQSVQLSMPNLPHIEDGDTVAVAGDVIDGVLIARAYRNFDNNAHGQWKHSWRIFTLTTVIVVFPLIALYIFSVAKSGEYLSGIVFFLIPFMSTPYWAISGITQTMKTARAAQMVRSVDG